MFQNASTLTQKLKKFYELNRTPICELQKKVTKVAKL